MPEVWVNLDKTDEEISPDADLYLDIRVLYDPRYEAAAKANGCLGLEDLMYMSDLDWESLQEAMPPELRGPKGASLDKFHHCDVGFDFCSCIESFVNNNADQLDKNWDQQGSTLEQIREFREVLELAKAAGAKFNIIFGS
ncbi:MAG: hypothetical protein HRT45_17180 [Bdellovibrionales bacterium]|nr:hypothetical protein [Bdellovibrionales bacterium]